MKEELEVIEENEAGSDLEIIVRCRREIVRLAIFGGALVFGVNFAMASM
jgi:hypothetical protein